VLASLGRPEAWPSAALYALWLGRTVPGTRIMAVVGIASIPLLWFGISALTAKSWLRAGDLALNSANVIHANKFTGVAGRLLDLYTLPMQIAGGLALILAAVIRDRVWVTLAAAALLWVLVEIAFALHGWSAVPRYLFEPAAVLITLTGAAVGRAVAYAPPGPAALRWAGPTAVTILLVALIPTVSQRIGSLSDQVGKRRVAQVQLHRLQAVIDRLGGPAGVRACGQPVTLVGWQSTVAWETDLNVGNVGYKPGREIERGYPIVLLKPHSGGWQVRPIHTLPARRAACAGLRTDTQFSPS
jgi:hypothetical protein